MGIISSSLLSTLSLDLLAIEKVRPDRWWNFKQVNSPFSRLYLVDGGTAFVRHHGQTWALAPGTLHLIPCFIPCDYFCDEPFDLYYLSFTARLAGGCDLFTIRDFDFSVPDQNNAKKMFERLIELNPGMALVDYDPYKPASQIMPQKKQDLSADEAAGVMESTGILRQMLSLFLRTAHPALYKKHTHARRFEPALDFIDRNLSRSIELHNLAKLTQMNPTYFSDVFHRTFGERPTVFITRRRIEKAQLLLLTSSLQIQEIADACGFSDTPYFTRTFKKITGESPKTYRQGHRSAGQNL